MPSPALYMHVLQVDGQTNFISFLSKYINIYIYICVRVCVILTIYREQGIMQTM